MPRRLTGTALLWAALASWTTWAALQPDVAHARSTLISEFGPAMCSEGAQTVLPEGFAFGRALSLLSAAAPAAMTSAVTADERAGVSAAEGEDEGPPAWCISPDDPRCTPRDQGAPPQSQRASTPMQDASAVKLPELAFGRSVGTLRPVQLGAARTGVVLQLERPPEQP